jgi:hypothetical protein
LDWTEVAKTVGSTSVLLIRVLSEMEDYPPGMPGRAQQWSQTRRGFGSKFPLIRAKKIERQFRELIGVKEGQSNGLRTTDKGPLPQ